MVLGLSSGQTRSPASSTASTASEIVRALRRRWLLRCAASTSESTRQSESKLELRIGVFLLFSAANGPTAAPQAAKRRKTPMRNSNLLSDCLVDSDVDAAQRNNQRRRKALTISLAVEAVLLAALLVWPLLNPSTMSARYAIDPIPPFPGGGHKAPQTSSPGPHITRDPSPSIEFHYPTIGERRRPAEPGPADDAPSIDGSNSEGNGSGDGPGQGTGIFGSPGNGPVPPRPPEPKT